jgi:hypothetical protein
LIIFIVPYVIAIARVKKALKKQSLTRSRTITIKNDGIHIVSENENDSWRWETLNKADIVDEYLYFSLFTKKFYLIPVRSFSSTNEAINFLGVLKNNIAKVKGQSEPRKINNLYYWGLLGFLPNFGAIAGIVLIVKGFQYNEIKLMLIGIAAILFTVFFWTVIFPYLLAK